MCVSHSGGSSSSSSRQLEGHCLHAAALSTAGPATEARRKGSCVRSPLAGQRSASHSFVHELIHTHGLGGFALGNRVPRRARRARRLLLPPAALLPLGLVVVPCVAAQHRDLQKRRRLVVVGWTPAAATVVAPRQTAGVAKLTAMHPRQPGRAMLSPMRPRPPARAAAEATAPAPR